MDTSRTGDSWVRAERKERDITSCPSLNRITLSIKRLPPSLEVRTRRTPENWFIFLSGMEQHIRV